MTNHYITKEIATRLYATMKRKNVSTNQMCRELNIVYPDFKAMIEGRQPCFNKWQKKIADTLGVERAELFREFTTKPSEQQDVLDKIRAELADMADADAYGDYQQGCNFGLMMAAQVIDKYKSESEK